MPQFKTLKEFEELVPKAIIKQPQDPFERRVAQLMNELDDDGQPELQSTNTNKSDSAFMHQLLLKEQFKEVQCQFQNDYFLTFKNKPQKDEIQKRAQILAKVYIKNNLQIDRNRVEQELNIPQKFSEDNDEHEITLTKNLTGFYQRQDSIEQDNNEQHQEILQRIDQLYFQLCQAIDERIYNYYQQGSIDECIIWKERKENLESDMLKVTDNYQLLKIIEVFKVYYQL